MRKKSLHKVNINRLCSYFYLFFLHQISFKNERTLERLCHLVYLIWKPTTHGQICYSFRRFFFFFLNCQFEVQTDYKFRFAHKKGKIACRLLLLSVNKHLQEHFHIPILFAVFLMHFVPTLFAQTWLCFKCISQGDKACFSATFSGLQAQSL